MKTIVEYIMYESYEVYIYMRYTDIFKNKKIIL